MANILQHPFEKINRTLNDKIGLTNTEHIFRNS